MRHLVAVHGYVEPGTWTDDRSLIDFMTFEYWLLLGKVGRSTR